eukprot:1160994-Pelagomonas_calceolata.AAC.11
MAPLTVALSGASSLGAPVLGNAVLKGDVPVGERECNRFECPDLPLVLTSPAPHDRVLSDDTFNITWNGGQMYGQVQLAIKRVDGSAALRSAASIRMATGAIKVIYARICHLTKSCFDLASDL